MDIKPEKDRSDNDPPLRHSIAGPRAVATPFAIKKGQRSSIWSSASAKHRSAFLVLRGLL
jgi:hypothetical protein